MKRSKFLIGLTATALVLPLGAISAGATEVAPADAAAWTEWISDDGGSGGRELPSISDNGRYVVVVGRGETSAGVWVKDRARPGTPAKLVWPGVDVMNPAISGDGRFVAWASYGNPRLVYRLKWQDTAASPTVVSRADNETIASPGTQSDFPSLSYNGRYVAFQSTDDDLDPDALAGTTGGGPNKVYVRDTWAGETEMVSLVDGDGGKDVIVNGNAVKPDITPDGDRVVFASDAGDLDVTATGVQQVYVRDRSSHTTMPVSLANGGSAVYGDVGSAMVYGPSISANGNKVAFESNATNLVAGDTNNDTDAFVRNILNETTRRVSVTEDGAQGDTLDTYDVAADPDNEIAFVDGNPVGAGPVISGNGLYVAFDSDDNLTADDANDDETLVCAGGGTDSAAEALAYVTDIYRFGLADGSVERQSLVDDPEDTAAFEATECRIDGHTGAEVSVNNGTDAAIAYDGTRIAFVSNGNLDGGEALAEDGSVITEGAVEPNTYLHRPNPEPENIPPVSKAFSPDVDRTSPIKVTYTRSDVGFPRSGVAAVRLYVKKPGWDAFKLVQVDRVPNLDNVFKVTALRDGKYRFYTRARDRAGNLEARPATADSVTLNP